MVFLKGHAIELFQWLEQTGTPQKVKTVTVSYFMTQRNIFSYIKSLTVSSKHPFKYKTY